MDSGDRVGYDNERHGDLGQEDCERHLLHVETLVPLLLQVIAVGGPQPQSTVQFTIANSDISSVSSSGLLEALTLGTTRVVGKAVGVDPLTGESLVYSQVGVLSSCCVCVCVCVCVFLYIPSVAGFCRCKNVDLLCWEYGTAKRLSFKTGG